MTIVIRFFAITRELAGLSELVMLLPPGATVAVARAESLGDFRVDRPLPRVAFAVNRAYAAIDTKLRDGDEVAVIPPVSGG